MLIDHWDFKCMRRRGGSVRGLPRAASSSLGKEYPPALPPSRSAARCGGAGREQGADACLPDILRNGGEGNMQGRNPAMNNFLMIIFIKEIVMISNMLKISRIHSQQQAL
jgi:hypothetical protein